MAEFRDESRREPEETENPQPISDPAHPPAFSDDGVDLTLIQWMLRLTPLERLRTAQRYANSARRLRNARRRI